MKKRNPAQHQMQRPLPRRLPRPALRSAAVPQLSDVVARLESIAPIAAAEPWDKVGLLCAPNPRAKIKTIAIALDLTHDIYTRCQKKRTDLLVCYHPPLFKPVEKLCPRGRAPADLAMRLFALGTAIYSPHTALDVAAGGTNDALASALKLRVTGSLTHQAAKEPQIKLVTFVPAEALDRVAAAVFAAGAGHIGQNSRYTCCSFRTPGTGTFRGDAESNPAVGRKEMLETVPEIRFETVLPKTRSAAVVEALRQSHPYEEPAYDLLELANAAVHPGLGRIAVPERVETLADFAARIKQLLPNQWFLLSGLPKTKIRRCAIVAGSAGTHTLQAHSTHPFDLLITGELKHHDLLAYHAAGIAVMLLGHGNSEAPVLSVLGVALRQAFPALRVDVLLPQPLLQLSH